MICFSMYAYTYSLMEVCSFIGIPKTEEEIERILLSAYSNECPVWNSSDGNPRSVEPSTGYVIRMNHQDDLIRLMYRWDDGLKVKKKHL
jgi:hypothetical protein